MARRHTARATKAHITVASPPDAASPPPAAPGNVAVFTRAETANRNVDQLSMVIARTNEQHRRVNTKKAYDPKVTEYYEFCNHYAALEHVQSRFTVTSNKAFSFLFYQAYRTQRNRGGGKRQADGTRRPASFDPLEFEEIQRSMGSLDMTEGASMPDPENPVGADVMNTYKSVVRKIFDNQQADNCNNGIWEHIYGANCRGLIAMVKARKPRVKRASHAEKLDGEFTPFTTVNQVPEIEEWFWDAGKAGPRNALTALRNRFAFLNCYGGILRHEALFLGELSDLLGIIVPRGDGQDALFISIMQMAQGKTVKEGGHRQFGRALRHKDVNLCPVGGLGFYLLMRFRMTKEMEDGNRPDFTQNSSWFDIKLMTAPCLTDHRLGIRKDSYVNQIRKCFMQLNIVASHFGHWGRVAGPAALELAEVDTDLIRVLGNWDATIQEKSYSSKIPVAALRVMAGYGSNEKHHNAR
jgi:hypothetical protein